MHQPVQPARPRRSPALTRLPTRTVACVAREHNEVDTGQEEVNVIIEGSGVYEVDGETIPVRAGSFMRFDPGTTRCPVAGPEGMTMIAVGVRPGSYEPHGNF